MGVPEPVCYDDNGAAWYPEGVSALLLKKLAFDVESMAAPAAGRGGDHGARALQRPAAQGRPGRGDAGRHRRCMGLVEEPVAAALHYGVVGGVHDQVLLVYDFGGGTFDATAMSMDARGRLRAGQDGPHRAGRQGDRREGRGHDPRPVRARAGPAAADGRPHAAGAAPRLGGDQDRAVPARQDAACAGWRCWAARRWRSRSRAASSMPPSRTSWTAPTPR